MRFRDTVTEAHELDNGFVVSVLVDGTGVYANPDTGRVEIAVLHPDGGFVQPSRYTDDPTDDTDQVVGYFPHDRVPDVVARVSQWDRTTVAPNFKPSWTAA